MKKSLLLAVLSYTTAVSLFYLMSIINMLTEDLVTCYCLLASSMMILYIRHIINYSFFFFSHDNTSYGDDALLRHCRIIVSSE